MKWRIARIQKKDRRLARKLHASVDHVVQGIKTRFGLWARKNHLAPVPTYTTFVLCAATMFNSSLKPNSVKTYMTNILRAFRWSMSRDAHARCRHALGKWEYHSRHQVAKRAVAITLAEAKTVTQQIQNPRARLAAELMISTPLRLADLCDVQWKEVTVENAMIVVRLVGGKNRRTQLERERLRLANADISPWLRRQLLLGASSRPANEHLVSMTTTELNRILQETSGKPITTYSLRNAFHRHVIAQHTHGSRVDWKEVAERTLHRSEKTAKAHYDQ